MSGPTHDPIEARFQRRMLLVYLAGIALVIVVQFLRTHWPADGALGIFYGSAPNLFAGACVPALFMIARRKVAARWPGLGDGRWFAIATLLGSGTVLAWECAQTLRANMVFDPWDLIATVIGTLLWLALWPWLRPRASGT